MLFLQCSSPNVQELQCSSPNVKELEYLKQKYSVEVINYFYETVFFQDQVGRKDTLYKWRKDIYFWIDGEFYPNDITNVENTITKLDSLQLPINMYLVTDSSLANIFVCFGDYHYLERKMGLNNYEPFVGIGRLTDYSPYVESAIIGIASDAKRYKRISETDSIILRQSILLEEITQCLGIIGDSWRYPNSIFFEGENYMSSLSIIDKCVVQLLYETSIPTRYSRQQFEKEFRDVLYHINAPQKIANFALVNNMNIHHLQDIREKCFYDSILIKWPSEVYIQLKGDFSLEDSVFCKNAIHNMNSISNQFHFIFDAREAPIINICYECDNNKAYPVAERQINTDNMMFPRRLKGDIKVTYRKQDSQETKNRLVLTSLYKSLGVDSNSADIMKLDSLGNISLKQDYKEILALIYEPVFYSGLTLREFDEAIEILKEKGYETSM